MFLTKMLSRVVRRWAPPRHRRQKTHRRPARQVRSFMPRLEILEDRTVLSTWTVTSAGDSGDGSLRAVIAAAQSGDQIVFDPSLQGQTITLTSGELAITKSLDIEGLGADQLAISGNHVSRIFNISGSTTVVTIAGLTITDGLVVGAPARGGAILMNAATNLTIVNDVLSNNEALGVGANGLSGAIDDNGPDATLTVTHCLFLHNLAMGSNAAAAGAIKCSGSTTVTDSTFIDNQSIGGSGGNNGFSRGGAIYQNSTGTLTLENCRFIGNQAIAGSGNSGLIGRTDAQAFGGAIGNTDNGILFVNGSTFTDNQAIGGSNNTSVTGPGTAGTVFGGALTNGWVATVTNCTFEHNAALGGSGNAGGSGFSEVGCAFGGAIANVPTGFGPPGILTASHLTLRNNRAVGGAGNTSGNLLGEAIGGGLYNAGAWPGSSGGGTATVSDSTIADNQAIGGNASAGGDGRHALGGGMANVFGATLTVSGATLTGNQARGGAGANGLGGGLFNDGPSTDPINLGATTTLTVLGSTITGNEAEGGATSAGGSSAGLGAGGGIVSAGILTLLGSTLAHNVALGHDGAGPASGGDGLGGGLYIAGGTASVLDTAIHHNRAFGGDGDAGGNGGNGFGGGVYVAAGTVIVVTSDIADNQAIGGLGGDGGTDGLGVGGGVYNLGTFLFHAATVIYHNRASDSNDDCFGC
jgi:hypothetical protein